ncbi:MAG TPA: hypothetical protein VE992_04615 [Solirubrobacteraceae bacterium]|nr:hypothetical protein [Solirubrobacteraceae bacterium]
MATRDIRTSTPITVCDVCGRTLLRGERAHAYLDGGTRRSVCELCTSRAVHEGWVLEGTELPYDPSRGAADRRRSLLGRLRGRGRERAVPEDGERDPAQAPARKRRGRPRRARELAPIEEPEVAAEREWDDEDYEYDRELGAPQPSPPPVRAYREPVREPRHVRAIPTSAEQKFAAAIEVFNGSEHRRTVAGVARSLGMPTVAVLAVQGPPGQVAIVASWELCWYRYEVDLSEDAPQARVTAQGYELDELSPPERQPNAVADESGALALAV